MGERENEKKKKKDRGREIDKGRILFFTVAVNEGFGRVFIDVR